MRRASRAAGILLAAVMVAQAGAAVGCTPANSSGPPPPPQAPSPAPGDHA